MCDRNTCFECGNPSEDLHHVIPRILGGTKTVPLCGLCHAKVHGRSAISSGALSKIGMDKAIGNGECFWVPYGYWFNREIRVLAEYYPEQNVLRIIEGLNRRRFGDVKIAEYLNENGYMSQSGAQWSGTGVGKKRAKIDKNRETYLKYRDEREDMCEIPERDVLAGFVDQMELFA